MVYNRMRSLNTSRNSRKIQRQVRRPVQRARQPRARRRFRTLGSLDVRTIGNWVGKGVNTIASWVPGADAIKQFCEFAFKNIGWAVDLQMSKAITEVSGLKVQQLVHPQGSTVAAVGKITGMGACVGIYPWALIRNTPYVLYSVDKSTSTRSWRCNYSHVRIFNLEVQIANESGITSGGFWCANLKPIYNKSEHDMLSNTVNVYDFEDLQRKSGTITARANTPIRLNHKVTVRDWEAMEPHKMSTPDSVPIFVIFIGYQRLERASYGNFSQNDVAPRITIGGKFQLENQDPFAYYLPTYDVNDYYEKLSMGIRTLKRKIGLYHDAVIENTEEGIKIMSGKLITGLVGVDNDDGISVLSYPSTVGRQLTNLQVSNEPQECEEV